MKAEEFQKWILDKIILLRDGKVMTFKQAKENGYIIERSIRLPHTELWVQVPVGTGKVIPPENVINNDALMNLLWKQSKQVKDATNAIAEAEIIVNANITNT